MMIILIGFTLFHLALAIACLAAGIRLLGPAERRMWRAPAALLAAELLVWIYPILAFVGAKSSWRAFSGGDASALPLMIAPIGWLIVMGIIFAVVDFVEDGILGNARRSGDE